MGNMTSAEEFQATKDDASEWGDPEAAPARSAKRRLAAMVSVRLSPEELERLQAHVESLGTSVSGYLRKLALDSIDDGHRAWRPDRVIVSNLSWSAPVTEVHLASITSWSSQACGVSG